MTHRLGSSPTVSISDLSPFTGYAYSYPHKSAYRPFDEPIDLSSAWSKEDLRSLFLYVHLPFCEHRCGFCNLFTMVDSVDGMCGAYLETIKRQMESVTAILPSARFGQLALGGGTPTFLSLSELQQLFAALQANFGLSPSSLPTAIEASPATVDQEKLRWLADVGVERISFGVQSFRPEDAPLLGRPIDPVQIDRALTWAKESQFRRLNIDLIYAGDQRQSFRDWEYSLHRALEYSPEEIYLYPLYVRPLTGLSKRGPDQLTAEDLREAEDAYGLSPERREWDDRRLAMYRIGRDILVSYGYEQVSFRMFQRKATNEPVRSIYRCQVDGMVGIGCGARSYTQNLHYSHDYAVGAKHVRQIIAEFINRSDDEFKKAEYGYRLDLEDARRRYCLMTLLQATGLSRAEYRDRFGEDVLVQLPQLQELGELGWMAISGEKLQLTTSGMERSDAIGPWLNSQRVNALSAGYNYR